VNNGLTLSAGAQHQPLCRPIRSAAFTHVCLLWKSRRHGAIWMMRGAKYTWHHGNGGAVGELLHTPLGFEDLKRLAA
jgi:hypothetical protein